MPILTRDSFAIYGWDDEKAEVYVHDGRPVHGIQSRWLVVYNGGGHLQPVRACLAPKD